MCKGSQTSTTTSAPNPAAMGAYNDLLGRAGGVSGLPFQTYGGEFVAPLNQQQQQAGANINQYAGFALPFIDQARGYATQAAQPITASNINQYLSPYTQDVVNATQAQFANQNAQQLNQVRGNAAAQGALGGDREAVAEAVTAGQQQTAEAPVIAGLYNKGYDTALNTALEEQRNLGQSAYSLGNLGVAGQNAALSGANAQLGFGTLGQSTQQALDQALYNQFLAQQAYPFQTTQWLAGVDTGVGSQMGGTSSTTGPAPNQGAQYAGLGLAALSFLNRGGGIHRDAGGRIRGFDMGGTPYAGGASYVPTIGITGGQGAPRAPGLGGQGQQSVDPFKLASSSLDLGKKIKGLGGGGLGGLFGSGDPDLDEVTQAGAEGITGVTPEELGIGVEGAFRRGGRIAGFADGGSPDMFEDHFSPFYGLDERLERGLGLGDVTGRYPVPGQDVPLPRSRPSTSMSDDDYPPMGVPVNGQPQNYFTGPIIRPGGNGGGPAEPLPAAQNVPDSRVAGVGVPPMNFAPQRDLSGYAPVTGTAGAPPVPDAQEKQSGFGGLFNNPLHLSPDMRKALLAAGFGTLASRSPFLGNAIGEGGLAGLSAYTGSEKEAFNEKKATEQLQQHADEFSKKLALETKKLEQQREIAEETRATPKKIGTDQLGQEVYAIRDPKTGKWTPIDSTTGQPVPEQKPIQVGSGQLQPAGAAAANAASAGELTQAQPGNPDNGIVTNHNQVLAAGAYDYSKDAPYIERGMEVPQPQALAGRSTAALQSDAEYYLETGKLPPVRGGKSPVAIQQQHYRNAVQNYGNAVAQSRGLTPEQMADAWRSSPGMLRFILGPDGRSTVALGTAVRHLDTIQQLAKAWAANDIQTINRLRAVISREFGSDAATNLQAAGRIVGPEIIKAIGVAGAGTAEERHAAEIALGTAGSPEQLLGAVATTQKLLGGQLEGRRRQAMAAGISEDKFKGLIGDRPYELLTHTEAPPAGGGHPQAQQALEWANAHPNDPRAVAIKQRLGVQ